MSHEPAQMGSALRRAKQVDEKKAPYTAGLVAPLLYYNSPPFGEDYMVALIDLVEVLETRVNQLDEQVKRLSGETRS